MSTVDVDAGETLFRRREDDHRLRFAGGPHPPALHFEPSSIAGVIRLLEDGGDEEPMAPFSNDTDDVPFITEYRITSADLCLSYSPCSGGSPVSKRNV